MKEQFIDKNFKQVSLDLLSQATLIIESFRSQGYRLSLRQLYYQMVKGNLIENTKEMYKRLGTLIKNARLAGIVDWYMIEDRGRTTNKNAHWEDPGDIMKSAVNSFAIDKWEDQVIHLEVMVEKDALSGVFWPVCERNDIRFTACKGYPSTTILHTMGARLENKILEDKEVHILHFGDHDPSGIDMTDDLVGRLSMFAREPIQVVRLALNMDQVDQYQPPENPAKVKDSRYNAYMIEFGTSSWELDALTPDVLGNLVEDYIMEHRDHDAWNAAVEQEDEYRDDLQQFVDKYE
jgi:hypothetical protein